MGLPDLIPCPRTMAPKFLELSVCLMPEIIAFLSVSPTIPTRWSWWVCFSSPWFSWHPDMGTPQRVLKGHCQQGSEKHGVRWGVGEYGKAGRQDWGLDLQTNAFSGRL